MQEKLIDRSGKELGTIGEPGVIANPTLSPDGGRVAVDIADLKANNVDLWLESTSGGGNARFTFDPAEEVSGVWSRDGSLIAYRIANEDGAAVVACRTGSEGRAGLRHCWRTNTQQAEERGAQCE